MDIAYEYYEGQYYKRVRKSNPSLSFGELQIIFANATRNNTVRIDAPSSFITLDRTNYQ